MDTEIALCKKMLDLHVRTSDCNVESFAHNVINVEATIDEILVRHQPSPCIRHRRREHSNAAVLDLTAASLLARLG